ncbi:MAG: tetratricopeptide repeat protein [Rickettsiales bacterium]|jgi:tetratricopeptide (TPR) repeat protein|nr:tetratricopeptide repeat protein [Rickettsiales bacterium]
MSNISDPSVIEIEANKPFVNSRIWKLQKDFYKNQGVSAWIGKVPFYITSNCFLARKYAEMLINLISDGLRNNTFNPKHPIYIFELGSGNGKFGYHLINDLMQCRKDVKDINLDIRYIMTDLCPKNIEFWKKHSQLKDMVIDGILDMGVFDADYCNDIQTEFAKKTVSKKSLVNPPIVIGNYFLDTISCDLLRFQSGKVSQGDLTLRTKVENYSNNAVKDLQSVDINYSFSDFDEKSVADKGLSQLINYYKNNVEDSTVLMPTTVFKIVDFFSKAHKKQKAFFMFSDKGHVGLESLQKSQKPHFAFHGSFSLMVNFHALKYYYSIKKGSDVLLQDDGEGMSIISFATNESYEKFGLFKNRFRKYANEFNVQNFMNLKNFYMDKIDSLSISEMVALLSLSNYDSKILLDIANPFVQKLSSISIKMKHNILSNLKKIEKNHFFLPNKENTIFELARVNYCLGNYAESVRLYKISIKYYGESLETLFNMGLSSYYANQKKLALECLEKLVKLDPNDKEAKDWIERIKKELKLS